MDKITFDLNEETMQLFIKDLLSLRTGSVWIRTTNDTNLKISFSGNMESVQKSIHDWLSVPERKHSFDLLGGK